MDRDRAVSEEEKRVRRLARMVDLALFYIRFARVDRAEAEALVEKVRGRAMEMFPDKAETFDLIYQPRFNRALTERFGLH